MIEKAKRPVSEGVSHYREDELLKIGFKKLKTNHVKIGQETSW